MSYQASPFSIVQGLQVGRPGYSFGSYNDCVDATNAYITNVALTSNVATVSLKLVDGAIPVTGQLITITGVSNTSGTFNVTNATVTGVSGFSTGDNSTGTVSFALTHANVVSAAAVGVAKLPVPEVAVALANGAGTQFAVAGQTNGNLGTQRTVSAGVTFPTVPTAATVTLQGAIIDKDCAL